MFKFDLPFGAVVLIKGREHYHMGNGTVVSQFENRALRKGDPATTYEVRGWALSKVGVPHLAVKADTPRRRESDHPRLN